MRWKKENKKRRFGLMMSRRIVLWYDELNYIGECFDEDGVIHSFNIDTGEMCELRSINE